MECKFCRVMLLECSDLFFFRKSEKDISLSIKPELLEVVLMRGTIYIEKVSEKQTDVKCKNCDTHVGSVCPFGPNGQSFYAFGCTRIRLNGNSYTQRQKWWRLYEAFSSIEVRDMATFYNTFNVKEAKVKKQNQGVEAQINYPSTDDLNHFEWYSVSHDKAPRQYQIEAYVEALQRNLVAVIKTGAGKTLIASMLLAKMCRLNPSKMGLFIVDRVPLAFQQGEALRKDTNLRVISISGENKTANKIKQLNNNCYDILVITAGAFYDMVSVKKLLDVKLFCAVVLDECHHVTKGHRYVDVLKLFTKMQKEVQPRILGLTASPINAKNFNAAFIGLRAFLSEFPDGTKMFFPKLSDSSYKIDEEKIVRTKTQDDFIRKCIENYDRLREDISKEIGMKDITSINVDLLKVFQAMGELRVLAEQFGIRDQNLNRRIKDAMTLLDAMEMCNLLGVNYGCQHLVEDTQNVPKEFRELADQFTNKEKESPRLKKLEATISTLKPESKILVFVSRRDIARRLAFHLQKQFKELNVGKVVGHGGYDGMDWEGGQKEIIKRFSTGSCNLLVCTSVLEEGIDVASCDLVVYFTGVKSLIKFIQARGRARKEGSQFIVYQSEGETSRKRDLQSEEKMLQKALEMMEITQYDLDNKSKEIIKQIEEDMVEENTKLSKAIKNRFFEKSDSDLSFMVYVDHIPDVKVGDIKDKLMDLLEEIQEFKLNRLDRINAEADIHSLSKSSFGKSTLRFLVGVKCVDCNNPLERYQRFCQIFPYTMEVQGQNVYMWTKLKKVKEDILMDEKQEEEQPPTSPSFSSSYTPAIGFKLGYFRNKISYVVGHTVAYQTSVSMKGTDVVLKYQNEEKEDREEQVIIPKTSIGNFVLLSTEKETFTVALHLNHCPTMEKVCNGENFERLTAQDNKIGEAFGKYPLLLLNFDKENFNTIVKILNTTMPIPCFDVKLQEVEEETQNMNIKNAENVEKIFWSLKHLEDSRSLMYLPETGIYVANKIAEDESNTDLIEKVVQRTCINSSKYFFSGFEKLLSHEYQTFKDTPVNEIPEDIVPNEHFLIKRVVVTPLRTIALPEVPVASNRMLRMLFGRFDIIVVSFKDEDGSKLRTTDTLPRVKDCIVNGVTINGKHFNFFAATSSQLRDHKAYFLAATMDDINNLRKEIIPFPEKFTCHAKYIARLGIYGTADKCVGKISDENINRIDDLFAENGDNVTDGAGKIAESKAKEFAEQLGLEEVPSAFQIRLSGTKGILVTSPDDDEDLDGKQIAIRPSMEKFKNNDKNFCVTSTSKINEFTLNREIISLLDAIPAMSHGLSKTLMNYQEKALETYAKMFSDITEAEEELRTYFPPSTINQLAESSMQMLDDPYWISILQGIYRLRTTEIRTKTSIPVDKACLIVGVPDPYGVLKEGEVFVQLKKSPEETQILEGSLLVFRNPCLHPGDIRTVTGVNKAELRHLHNVVVFPTKNCKESLAVSCSGGDLDGDQYSVIWDEDLIPNKEDMFNPCDYSGLATAKPKSNEHQQLPINDQGVLADFFCKFMSNDCLGRVAHKHLALCDILPKGARDPVACELARSQAQAVDFPKTGIVPDVPKEALELTKSFPDFMEKAVSETHVSTKVLGEMYRRCCSLMFDFGGVDSGNVNRNSSSHINHALIVDGSEKHLENAKKYYIKYAKEMSMVMKKFELKTEADIVLGQATLDWSTHLEADKGKAGKAIKACYDAIVEKYRSIFLSDVKDEQYRMEKASAWYRIVNDPTVEIERIGCEDILFSSFPWVVTDVLCDIRRRNNSEQTSRMTINIGKSALEHFLKNAKQLESNIKEKTSKLKDVERVLNKLCKEDYNLSDGFIVSAYGSTSIYVSEQDSDIDISVLPKSQEIFESNIFPEKYREEFRKLEPVSLQKHLLSQVISRAVDEISSSKREVLDAKVPIIKCTFADGDQELQCDISMNEVGFRKTLYIHHLYGKEPWYLPLFWILVRWARLSGIVKSELNSEKLIDTAEFYALIIYIMELPEMEKMELEKPSQDTDIEVLNRQCQDFQLDQYYDLGQKIFDFFRKTSTLDGNVEIKWPAPGIDQTVVIDDSVVKTISRLAGKAFHALSATRDVDAMLRYFLLTSNEKTELRKLLPLSMSYAIGKARAFHAARLSAVTGALVDIEIKEGKCNLVLTGKGSRLAIENLQNEIRSLMDSNKALVLGRLPHKGSRYFMEGSSIIIARNNVDTTVNLHCENSFSSYELHHETCQRSATYTMQDEVDGYHGEYDEDDNDVDSWKVKEKDRLYKHMYQQLLKFPTADNEELLQSLEVTSRFGTFYLVDIDCTLPDSQKTIQIQELQMAVEKGRRSRKAWERSEFKPNYDSYGMGEFLKETFAETAAENKFEMVPLPKGGNKERFREKLENDLYKVKKTRAGIAAAFSPGLLKNNTGDLSAKNLLRQTYREVLMKLNFKEGQCTKRQISPTWKVSVNPSASYETQVNLDENLNVLKVAERPLNWLHGTIIDGGCQKFNGQVRTNADIRLLVSTHDVVKEGTDLYQSVIPGGVSPFKLKDGKPVIDSAENTRKNGGRNFVSLIRNIQEAEVYTNGIVDACVVTGNVYFGDEMNITKSFCELSLLYNSKMVTEAIRDNFSDGSLRDFVNYLFDTSLKIKEDLDEALSKISTENVQENKE